MGLYGEQVLPRITDAICNTKVASEQRVRGVARSP